MRILLVEDDEMIGLSLSDALRREAMVVDWVRDGNDAAVAGRDDRFAVGNKGGYRGSRNY